MKDQSAWLDQLTRWAEVALSRRTLFKSAAFSTITGVFGMKLFKPLTASAFGVACNYCESSCTVASLASVTCCSYFGICQTCHGFDSTIDSVIVENYICIGPGSWCSTRWCEP